MGNMLSGRDTLGSIDESARKLRDEAHELDGQIQRASAELLRLRQAELEKYRALARIRIEQLARPDLVEGLDYAEEQVRKLLEDREKALQDLERASAGSRAKETELERERAALAARVEEAEKALDEAEAEVQERLEKDPSYAERLERARKAEDVARHAEEKTGEAREDRVEKGKPYEADPLFSYLWSRGYGTSEYRAWPVARYLDGKVAKLCDYARARPNYAMLLEIPARLEEHAVRLRKQADEELEALKALEDAAAKAGGLGTHRQALGDERAKLGKVDEILAAEEARYREIVEKRAKFAGGEDGYFQKAIEILVEEFRRDGMTQLRRQVEATPLPDDDAIVEEIIRIDEQTRPLEESLASYTNLLRESQRRLNGLESVRREFKSRGYDGAFSTFLDGSAVAVLLGQFLRGAMGSDGLWRLLEGQQTFRGGRSRPLFGSRGLGASSSGFSRSRRSGGLLSRGGGLSSGGRSGGGFRTGGGFGRGGGFRTGGGF